MNISGAEDLDALTCKVRRRFGQSPVSQHSASEQDGMLRVITAIRRGWSASTAGVRLQGWPAAGRAAGQCIVSALVFQDYFGGSLIELTVIEGGRTFRHVVNELTGGVVVDVTASQFGPLAEYKSRRIASRGAYLAEGDTRERYEEDDYE